jgi:hypothetical protein
MVSCWSSAQSEADEQAARAAQFGKVIVGLGHDRELGHTAASRSADHQEGIRRSTEEGGAIVSLL